MLRSIDEAIEQFKYDAKNKQIAEWLEELKAYREIGTVEGYKSAIECYTEEYTRRKSGEQYNKAIDDFAKALTTMYEKYDIDDVFESSDTYSYTSACYIFERYIYKITEQLKAGVKE